MPKCSENGHVTVHIETSGLCEACGDRLADAAESLMGRLIDRWVAQEGGKVKATVAVTPEGEMKH